MTDPNLYRGITSTPELVQNLCVNHRTTGLQAMLGEELCTIEFERTIYIAHRQFKHQPDQHLPAPGIELAYPCILSVDAIAQHGITLLDERKEALKIINIKLPIEVHKEDKLLRNRL